MALAPLNIVLTNDDGFDAPGIQTLYTALVNAGFNVHIVAPAVNQSAQGSSLGGTTAVDSTRYSKSPARVFSVIASPACTCFNGRKNVSR